MRALGDGKRLSLTSVAAECAWRRGLWRLEDEAKMKKMASGKLQFMH